MNEQGQSFCRTKCLRANYISLPHSYSCHKKCCQGHRQSLVHCLHHWMQAMVNVYDSAANTLHTETKKRLPDFSTPPITLQYMNVQLQLLLLPYVQYQSNCLYFQAKINEHFLSCINKGQIEQFPIKQSHRAITRLVKIDTIDIHCHCRMLENPQDRIMLCNGSCKQWYHETH